MKVKEATISVTNRCNLRCQACSIWRNKDNHCLSPEHYHNLPPMLTQINLKGGEPFLREDLLDVVEVLKKRCTKAKITITTNGVLIRVIEEKVRWMPDITLRVLINGAKKVHDKISGVNGAYQKSIQTLKKLKSLGLKNLCIAINASRLNQENLIEVKEIADRLGVGFECFTNYPTEITLYEQKDFLPQPQSIIKQLEKARDSYLNSIKPERWKSAYFLEGLIDHLDGKTKEVRCMAGTSSFYLKPNGDISPCKALKLKMGNIKEAKVEDIIENSEHIKEAVRLCPHQCWEKSTVNQVLRDNPFKILSWGLKNKLKIEFIKFMGNSFNGNQK